jgi:hypothetical protein
MLYPLNLVESIFLIPLDSDYNARNLWSVIFSNGRIFVSLTFRDDGPAVNRGERQPYPPFPMARFLDSETDLLAWKDSIPQLLALVKKHATN